MKYNTISTSSISSEGKKSTLTIYTDPDFVNEKVIPNAEMEIASIRGELETVQRALKLQTTRCRQLVAEYTKRLQEKEQQYQSERTLRNDQLAKVLRALLIFEARLKQEQKFITHQLEEKDHLIKKQRHEISRLISNQYCKHCNQYYSLAPPAAESLDSSSDYVVTDYHDYQSSTLESLDSSSETYATVSEKDYKRLDTLQENLCAKELNQSNSSEEHRNVYQKNKFNKDSIGRRGRKFTHKKSIGTYFEVLKLRNESPLSNEDNTSNDFDNFESLPTESINEQISTVSDRIENIFNNSNSITSNDSDCNNTVIRKEESETSKESPTSKISESIPVFEAGEESNEKWYASGSDQEDVEQRDIYRNNPVLECMNQILLRNIDSTSSPPKTPNVERKLSKNKRVKFSDEENDKEREVNDKEREVNDEAEKSDYYETPVQKQPNFYETPQSIYSNDYEQIGSKSSGSLHDGEGNELIVSPSKKLSITLDDQKDNKHYYEMDVKPIETDVKIVRKTKISRTPPALPPKPSNLVKLNLIKSKQMQLQNKIESANEPSIESEPDYCSISELNIPVKNTKQKINVVAEINMVNVLDNSKDIIVHKPKEEIDTTYEPLAINNEIGSLVSKNIEKFSIQLAKQTPIKTENLTPSNLSPPSSNLSPSKVKIKEADIPKLPQVSEIIIPEDTDGEETRNDTNEEETSAHINYDNYIKNNSQILKVKNRLPELRRPIAIGTSVSSLITGFNNQQLLSEIQQKPKEPFKPQTKMKSFSSFENLQNCERQRKTEETTPSFDNFDLSQNFEEFKLEDCEILEEYDIDNKIDVMEKNISSDLEEQKETNSPIPSTSMSSSPSTLSATLSPASSTPPSSSSPASNQINKPLKSTPTNTRVELVRATNNVTIPLLNVRNVEEFRRKLETNKPNDNPNEGKCRNEPTYEHFLECTGLSTKSILTPARLISNHKGVLKPKDVKLRSRTAKTNVFERQGSTIKYWSEPYI